MLVSKSWGRDGGKKIQFCLKCYAPVLFIKKILNFEAIIIKIGMYVHFDIQKYIPKNNLKNAQNG